MSDIISQAMGILGGGKKDKVAPRDKPQQRVMVEQSPVRPSAPAPERTSAQVRDRMSSAERRIVTELARYASLHAAIIEIRQEMERGQNHLVVESKLDQALGNAKVVIR
jgi:hypothetical protein